MSWGRGLPGSGKLARSARNILPYSIGELPKREDASLRCTQY